LNEERVRVRGEGRAKRKEEGEGVLRAGVKNRGRERMGSIQEKREGEGIVRVVEWLVGWFVF